MSLGPVVVDIAGTRLNATDREHLMHPNVGMVILFARNFESPEQLKALTQEIHAVRSPKLLIAVDHEGGRVQRFKEGFTAIPAMANLGSLWARSPIEACRSAVSAGFVMAAELRAHGVDLTFAPVLDLDWRRSGVIGDRAFGADAHIVTILAAQICHGMALAGMANCGKHFPGHGWALADSHHEIPTDERPLEKIVHQDAAPYRGLGVALASVMPAHVVYPEIDALPAGFSRIWIQDILRHRLGFSGAVFSDDLMMEGARVAGGVSECGVQALEAGCDFILVCNDMSAAAQVLDHVRWRATPEFLDRCTRLIPIGPERDMENLRRDARYQSALADLSNLVHVADSGS